MLLRKSWSKACREKSAEVIVPEHDRTPRRPLAAKLGAAGFLIPLLLPLSLCLVVSYALRAERNLNRYLHDYD